MPKSRKMRSTLMKKNVKMYKRNCKKFKLLIKKIYRRR